jgi:DNA-binding NarL/FixJ family response regulator
MNPIRVIIVDDHPMLRRGLRNLLSEYPDMQVVGDFADGETTLESVAALQPDVILLDIKLPGMDGVTVSQQIQQIMPEAKIIHLTAYQDDEFLQSAFRTGAYAYLLKSAPYEVVIDTVRRVYHGEHLLSPALMDQVLRQFKNLAQAQARQETGLSEEDLKVLQLIAKGATNEEIAEAMYWSDRTARRKIEEISAKLDARNRTQAVAEAIKRRLI